MRPQLIGATLFKEIRQLTLKLCTGHTTSLPKYGSRFSTACAPFLTAYPAFSALLVLRKSRNFIRALCNCDLLFPIEQPTIVAISLCS